MYVCQRPGLATTSNETLQRHVINVTSSAPPTSQPVTSRGAAVRHSDVAAPPHYDDVNIPSDSYFTGSEEIPVWNVPDHVPLLDTVSRDQRDVINPASDVTQRSTASTGSGYEAVSTHRLVTSSVHDVTSLKRNDNLSTTRLQAHVPHTTTVSTQSTTTTTSTTRTTSTSRDQGHVITDHRDVTTVKSTVGRNRSSVYSAAVVPRPHVQARTAQRPQQSGRRPNSPGLVAGSGSSLQAGMDYLDFFDYVVDYRTPRPPTRRRVQSKTGRRRRKKVEPRRVKHSQSRSRSRSSGDKIYIWPLETRPGAFDQTDVVGQSQSRSENAARSVSQRGRVARRKLPQSLPVLIVRTLQPQHHGHRSVEVQASSAAHVAANLGLRASSGRLLKEAEDQDSAQMMSESVEPVTDRTQVRGNRVIYSRPTSPRHD